MPVTGSCLNFDACGGDPTGRWSVFDVCYDVQAFRTASAAAIEAEACTGWLLDSEISVFGPLVFADGQLDSQLVLVQRLDTLWTQDCLRAVLSPDTVLDEDTCDAIGESLSTDSESGTTCLLADGLCTCVAEVVSRIPSVVDYSIEDGQVVTPKGRSDFCRTGNELLFRGQAGPNMPDFLLLLRRD